MRLVSITHKEYENTKMDCGCWLHSSMNIPKTTVHLKKKKNHHVGTTQQVTYILFLYRA